MLQNQIAQVSAIDWNSYFLAIMISASTLIRQISATVARVVFDIVLVIAIVSAVLRIIIVIRPITITNIVIRPITIVLAIITSTG